MLVAFERSLRARPVASGSAQQEGNCSQQRTPVRARAGAMRTSTRPRTAAGIRLTRVRSRSDSKHTLDALPVCLAVGPDRFARERPEKLREAHQGMETE